MRARVSKQCEDIVELVDPIFLPKLLGQSFGYSG